MSQLIRKQHNVSILLYHIVCPAKYRRAVFTPEVDEKLKEICAEIALRYEIEFLEIGTDQDHVHWSQNASRSYALSVQDFSCYTLLKMLEVCSMSEQRRGSHTVTRLSVHIVWTTKYRYHVLKGEIQKRCRELLIQICDSEDIKILSGVVSKDHVHMHLEYPPRISISDLVKRLKGRTSRKLQDEYPELKKRYWGNHFWAIGYGAWSTGNITDEQVQEYLEHHREPSNKDTDPIILE